MKSPHEILDEVENFFAEKTRELREWLSSIGHPQPDPQNKPPVQVQPPPPPPPPPKPVPTPDPEPLPAPDIGPDPTGGSRADMP